MPISSSARQMMMSKKAQKAVSSKIKEVMHKGIKGKKVSQKQAVAVGLSVARKKGYKIPKK